MERHFLRHRISTGLFYQACWFFLLLFVFGDLGQTFGLCFGISAHLEYFRSYDRRDSQLDCFSGQYSCRQHHSIFSFKCNVKPHFRTFYENVHSWFHAKCNGGQGNRQGLFSAFFFRAHRFGLDSHFYLSLFSNTQETGFVIAHPLF